VAFLFTTSCLKNDQIPSYYFVFSIIGFLSGLCWIYVIANELVAVLQASFQYIYMYYTILILVIQTHLKLLCYILYLFLILI